MEFSLLPWVPKITDGLFTHSYIQVPASLSMWVTKNSEKSAQSSVSHFWARRGPCCSATLYAPYSVCKNSSPPHFLFPYFKCSSFSGLTMHALGLGFYLSLVSQTEEGREALAALTVLEVEGILRPRESLERVINWKPPQVYHISSIEVVQMHSEVILSCFLLLWSRPCECYS